MADAVDDPETFWVDPQMRGVMPLEDFHVPRRLARTIKRAPFDMRIDTDFRQTIEACRMASADRPTSWINDDILFAYCKLHAMGYAHSVECWHGDRLVGGLYGVCIAGAFFGESMFSRQTDASKIALTYLVARLKYARLRPARLPVCHRPFGALRIEGNSARHLSRKTANRTRAKCRFSPDAGKSLAGGGFARRRPQIVNGVFKPVNAGA